MVISRRFFLVGTAAAIVAASTKILPVAGEEVVRLPTQHKFLRRQFVGLDLMNDGAPLNLHVYVRQAANLLNIGAGPGCNYCWRAIPGGGVELRPQDAIKLVAEGGGQQTKVSLTYIDYVDKGPGITLVETYDYPFEEPSHIYFMHTDNSLEARLERAKQSISVPQWNDDPDDPSEKIYPWT